jgi:hypothetical protein
VNKPLDYGEQMAEAASSGFDDPEGLEAERRKLREEQLQKTHELSEHAKTHDS